MHSGESIPPTSPVKMVHLLLSVLHSRLPEATVIQKDLDSRANWERGAERRMLACLSPCLYLKYLPCGSQGLILDPT